MFRRHGLGEVAITAPAEQSYYEEAHALAYDVVLTSGEEKLNQAKLTEGDGDFRLLALAGVSTGAYQVRLRLPSGRWFPTSYAKNSNIIGTAQFPVPVEPGPVYKAGQAINFDIKDTSGAGNTIQILLIGVKLLKVR